MKTIIAGSRHYDDLELIIQVMQYCPISITEVISGGCQGIDALGEQWAMAHNVPITRFPAEWDEHGKAAGPIRNKEMIDYAEAAIVIWDGKSRGTANLLKLADKKRKTDPTFLVHLFKEK